MSIAGLEKLEKVLIFGGTTEGRLLFDALAKRGFKADLSVATEYGREVVEKQEQAQTVYVCRLNTREMVDLIRRQNYSLIVDATHPYAILASETIREAAVQSAVPCFRLVRSAGHCDGDMIVLPDVDAAVAYLSQQPGKILAAIGTKHLAQLSRLPDFASRVIVRLLPDAQAIETCKALGLPGKNIIAMQGPFSFDLNKAMLVQCQCRFLLTKNSGEIGGFAEKAAAAKAAGAMLVIIDRPSVEQGLNLDDLIAAIEEREATRQ